MLETIREFAAERLDQMPEADATRAAHASVFLALAESGGRPHAGLARKRWLERLDLEHNNIRTALSWYEGRDPASALRLAASMAAFWSLRGHHTEGRQRLRDLLGRVPEATVARVTALNGSAWLAIDQGDYADGDRLLGESIGLAASLGDAVGEGIAMLYRGRCKLSRHQIGPAAPEVERGAALLAQAGDRPAIALSLMYSGLVTEFSGRLDAACELFTRCVALSAELGLEPLTARARQVLGCALVDLGDLAGARAALEAGLPGSMEVGDRWIIAVGLAAFAGHAARTGRPGLALRLAGAAQEYQDVNKFEMPGPISEMVGRWLAPARASAGSAAERLLAEGRQLSVEQAVNLALANQPEDTRRSSRPRTLTRREVEVARLAARGQTNREIAAELSLSVRTVEVHVEHVLTKLDFRTRTQLAAWAYEEGLLRQDT
jgi:non-specific serine/threonine protein kinase